jgi:cobalt/nickel transport system permease protein
MVGSPLLAVHISDGVLTWPWLTGGFAGAVILALFGAWRIRDEEIPRVALLTAAFFVASLIHVKVGGVTSAHLLLNGLIGAVLGWRAGLAILVGLALQFALFQHGGWSTLGINTCIMTLPALVVWQLFKVLRRLPWLRLAWFRAVLIATSTAAWTLSLVYSVALLLTNRLSQLTTLDTDWANHLTFQPITLAAVAVVAMLAAWVEWRLDNAPEFALGLLVGELAVLGTVFLNFLVLLWGSVADMHVPALITLIVHIPLTVIEGIVLGFTVGFLARVKPEMLGWTAEHEEETRCLVDSVP